MISLPCEPSSERHELTQASNINQTRRILLFRLRSHSHFDPVGRPAPAVSWKWRHKVIDDSYLTLSDFQALKRANQLLSATRGGAATKTETTETGTETETLTVTVAATTANSAPTSGRAKSGGLDKNPINAGALAATTNPSFQQLDSLMREWQALPEYDFFVSTSGNDSSAPTSGQRKSPDGSGGGGGTGGTNSAAGQLLTMNVHDSIATSVNVLQLPRAALAGLLEPSVQSQSANSNLVQANVGAAAAAKPELELECQASNLHYDLRTLIKMFAPPSLTPPSQHPPPPQQQRADVSERRQLVDAIDRALESAIWGSTNLASEQQQSGEHAAAAANLSHATATALRQIKLLEAAATSGGQTSSSQSPVEQLGQRQTAAAATIYQQLWRPHQLSGAASEQPEVASPSSASLVRSQRLALEVYLRPRDVKITSPQRPLSAGQLAELSCSASGARPPARLTWWKNGQLIDERFYRQIDEPSGNVSHSKLSIQLERQDHGAQLACRAENEHLSALESRPAASSQSVAAAEVSYLEDSRMLTVQYAPKVRLELGNKILSSSIKEGSDIYFVCSVEAVPPVKEITWLHNDKPINETTTSATHRATNEDARHAQEEEAAAAEAEVEVEEAKSIITSNNSLVLQRVRLNQRGQYTCVAFNSEGISESNRIELRVLHAPICAIKEQTSTTRRLQSRAKFLCQMEAEPADLELTWYLNNTHNERRVLLEETISAPSYKASAAAAQNRNIESARWSENNNNDSTNSNSNSNNNNNNNNNNNRITTVSSQLNFLLESPLDYGQLYCVAKNSVGQQKRPCVYQIHLPDLSAATLSAELEEPPQAQTALNCLAVNVTSNSAWIGCESASQVGDADQKLAVEVFSGHSARSKLQPTQAQQQQLPAPLQPEELYANELGQLKLEANLTTSAVRLSEPLFSVNNLRPQTGYMVRVLSIDSSTNRPKEADEGAIVRFVTKPASQMSTTSGGGGGGDDAAAELDEQQQITRHHVEPSIEQISASPQQSSLLLSALISTRSTNGNNNNHHHHHHQQQQQPAQDQQTAGGSGYKLQQQSGQPMKQRKSLGAVFDSFIQVFWPTAAGMGATTSGGGGGGGGGGGSSGASNATAAGAATRRMGSLLAPGTGRQRLQQQQSANNQLMELSDALLISSACFLLLASLAVVLILYRYSARACSSSSPYSSGSLSSAKEVADLMGPASGSVQLKKRSQPREKKSAANVDEETESPCCSSSCGSDVESSSVVQKRTVKSSENNNNNNASYLNDHNRKRNQSIERAAAASQDGACDGSAAVASPAPQYCLAYERPPTMATLPALAATFLPSHGTHNCQTASAGTLDSRLRTRTGNKPSQHGQFPISARLYSDYHTAGAGAQATSAASATIAALASENQRQICVPKSRSALCLESLLMNGAAGFAQSPPTQSGRCLNQNNNLVTTTSLIHYDQRRLSQQIINDANPVAYEGNIHSAEGSQTKSGVKQQLSDHNNSADLFKLAAFHQEQQLLNHHEDCNFHQQSVETGSDLLGYQDYHHQVAATNSKLLAACEEPANFAQDSNSSYHYIQLLPANEQDFLNLNLVDKIFTSSSSTGSCTQQLDSMQPPLLTPSIINATQLNGYLQQSNQLCPSITSSSVASCSSVKDQAISSLLSLSNTTLSNNETPLLLASRQEQPAKFFQSQTSANNQPTSILKNSHSKHNYNQQHQRQHRQLDDDSSPECNYSGRESIL